MLDLSPEKLFVLGVLAMLVLGPERLPSAARTLGRWLGQLRSMSSSFQEEVRQALHEPEAAISQAVAELRPAQIRRNVRQAVTSTLAPPAAPSAPAAPEASVVPLAAPGGPTAGPGIPAGPAGHPDDPALN
ncbi:MAG TPA: twin-arginine translocase TatA/TatE family subunit [Acidimicrobiales bacterium]|nr:twin-arginine translocase TatA/TatE family subunit [Acidimicrobiales bacterium]